VRADKEGTRSLICALNTVLREKGESFQSDADLDQLFELCWVDFERALRNAPKVPQDAGPERSTTEILGELLSIARMHSRLLASIIRAAPPSVTPIERAPTAAAFATSPDMKRLDFEELRRSALDLRSAGRHVEAIEGLKRALDLSPKDLETLIDVAVTETYLDDPQYRRSIDRLTELVKGEGGQGSDAGARDSIVAKAYYNLACIKTMAREASGNSYAIAEILGDLESALLRYPLYVGTARTDQDLVSLRELAEFQSLIERYQRAQR
jgi:tetratricopeptide (TPR) repeat protein